MLEHFTDGGGFFFVFFVGGRGPEGDSVFFLSSLEVGAVDVFTEVAVGFADHG